MVPILAYSETNWAALPKPARRFVNRKFSRQREKSNACGYKPASQSSLNHIELFWRLLTLGVTARASSGLGREPFVFGKENLVEVKGSAK